MSIIAIANTSLKGFACLWSFLLMAISAAFYDKSRKVPGLKVINHSIFGAGEALIYGSLLYMVYGVVSFFFIFYLASTATLSTNTDFSYDANWAHLGLASIALGWIMTILVLSILAIEVIYTLVRHDRSYSTWKIPFNQLLQYHPSSSKSRLGRSDRV
ncbi:uncharacterized protein L201_002193 [Kwoniella dendrophila CBS 6074]|uniref:Uncharacterized protein n=1 Tax=Kwoniella dendrophila CBS 6074 TaxID=1295534 RepID=A0AAX4JS22_9TREE